MMTDQEQAQLVGQAQSYQQQMQNFMVQKETLNMQLMEVKKAIEDLEGTNDAEVYKISGPLLIKTKQADAQKELKEKQELLEARVKNIDKKETQIKEKIEEIREKLTKGSGASAG
ncbi:MAG: prefoldin subunit beta [Candidatus Aenigmatarchaeota archaeon]|nr:MAG: prefoldin subunit beta [Candidatus Aenigmarchaeota archaeon]